MLPASSLCDDDHACQVSSKAIGGPLGQAYIVIGLMSWK